MVALSNCLALVGLLAAADGLRRNLIQRNDPPVRDWPSTKFYMWVAWSPHRGMVNTAPACCGWSGDGAFFAFGTSHPGMTKYNVWEAHGPHRVMISKSGPCCGWSSYLSFYAFDSKQPNTKQYYVWSTTKYGAHRAIMAESPACCGWKNEFTFWAYASPPGHVALCSDISQVTGKWASLGTIVGTQTRTEKYGTQRTNTSISARTYANSVAIGIEVSAEVKFPWGSLSPKVSTEYRHEWSRSYTNELTTTLSSETTFQIEAGMDHQGKHLWQFQFDTRDKCMSASKTLTQSYAFTESKASGPCCYPGHCRDAARGSCSWCTPGYIAPAMRGYPQCKEGKPYCKEGTFVALLYSLPGFVVVPEQLPHDQQLLTQCPDGFSGQVVLQCELGVTSILAQSCKQM